MGTRFRFHSNAVAASGTIREPFCDTIPVQGSVALPEMGGYGSAHVQSFDYRHMISFREARTHVIGRCCGKDGSHETLAVTSIEGVNVFEMVMIDRVVARLHTKHPTHGQPRITLTGSCIENLRICGRSFDPDLAIDTISNLPTWQDIQDDKDGEFARLRAPYILSDDECTTPEEKAERVAQIQDERETEERGREKGVISCCLARNLENFPADWRRRGKTIYIEGFGTIRLAEVQISQYWRRLTMIEVIFECPLKGHVMMAAVEGNGSDW